jgi:hypothetical protein
MVKMVKSPSTCPTAQKTRTALASRPACCCGIRSQHRSYPQATEYTQVHHSGKPLRSEATRIRTGLEPAESGLHLAGRSGLEARRIGQAASLPPRVGWKPCPVGEASGWMLEAPTSMAGPLARGRRLAACGIRAPLGRAIRRCGRPEIGSRPGFHSQAQSAST